jgi:hypothetical protein
MMNGKIHDVERRAIPDSAGELEEVLIYLLQKGGEVAYERFTGGGISRESMFEVYDKLRRIQVTAEEILRVTA